MTVEAITDALANAASDHQIALVDRDINCLARSLEVLVARAWREGVIANDCPNCNNKPEINPYRSEVDQ